MKSARAVDAKRFTHSPRSDSTTNNALQQLEEKQAICGSGLRLRLRHVPRWAGRALFARGARRGAHNAVLTLRRGRALWAGLASGTVRAIDALRARRALIVWQILWDKSERKSGGYLRYRGRYRPLRRQCSRLRVSVCNVRAAGGKNHSQGQHDHFDSKTIGMLNAGRVK